jgi:geranylgeranyl diphosphate synthase type II
VKIPFEVDHPAAHILTAHARCVETFLAEWIDMQAPAIPPKLAEAIRYSLLAGGKRLRPALVLETAVALTASSPPELSQSALAAAGALELIHTFSLVHDDLPAMDDDDLRRGRPTNHKVFGEAMAILAGDAMTTLAFELIADRAEPPHVGMLVHELARASGPRGMIGGQVLDMAGENRRVSMEELQRIHRLKTGALIRCAVRMGAIVAGATGERLEEQATGYGEHLGVAFQIVDDMLDVTSTPAELGKATQKDAVAGKNTYPALIGLDASRAAANQRVESALAAVVTWGTPAEGLRHLARFVTDRTT